MSTTTHPHIEQISGYLSNPTSKEHRELGLHLAQCSDCRAMADTLSKLENHLESLNSDAYHLSMQSDPELRQMLEDQSIENFVDGQLVGIDKQSVITKLAQDKMALKAALHYASHSSAMADESRSWQPCSSPGEKRPSGMPDKSVGNQLWAFIKAWMGRPIPIWTTIPSAGLATAVLIFALITIVQPPQRELTIAGYRDNPVLQMRPASNTPGIGFFSSAPQSVIPFDHVKVSLKGKDSIAISWPAVSGAKAYTIRLMAYPNGIQTILNEKTTLSTRLTFEGLEIGPGRRYEWMLSGETVDSQFFYAEGGFVINHGDE
jgi:hypothetical protein